MEESATERRTCRCCGEGYAYPKRKSVATRTYCENCVQMPAEPRRAIERLRRRVERLAKALDKATAES